jgi:hypothetical protein
MIRILVIDDVETPDSLAKLEREIAGSFRTPVDIKHLNPVDYIRGRDEARERESLLQTVRTLATEFWDIALVDLNLGEVVMEEADLLELPLSIVEAFRGSNRAAMVILYSGTLARHIPKLIAEDSKSTKQDAERVLKRIFLSGVVGFVPRDEIGGYVYASLDEPSWLLCVDRLLTASSNLSVKVEESEFKEKRFADLALAVRRQDTLGKRVAGLVAEFGVASLVDLNK